MKTLNLAAVAAALALGLGAASAASAATNIYDYRVLDPAAGFNAGPYGTVTVTENAGALDFLVQATPPYRIHDGNSNHNSFVFDLNGDPGLTVSLLTSGFTFLPGPNIAAPPFNGGSPTTWDYGVDCSSACGAGYPGGYAGALSFEVKRSDNTALTLASLQGQVSGGHTVYFATDFVQANGKTGNIGATLHSAAPEPASWALMLLGFGGIGAMLRARRRSAVLQA